ncbi:synaptobrevin-like protein [Grosmannia clavigera kw1407]|uniref:Synaptobrevin homolog YKT6 n=1 Tax=Grosmannia clavigera (strain kw1407 / UAMH 11150) TaxID=655863 RepID=F0XHV4_GROCL|nr:synaptobrevin-like protein [Grosmannia clavigera kw1407]EFX03045.1 synaptobrevin-like protein [Grosmannia clavigera kw1407]
MASPSGPATPLLYACVAHNTTILAECTTSAASQTSSLASLILPKIEHRTPQKLTYTHGSHHIHYIAEATSEHAADRDGHPSSAGGLTFLVIAEAALGRRVPFAFLAALRTRFLADFPAVATDFADLPNYGCASFNGTLRAMMVEQGSAGVTGGDVLTGVRRDIEDVRGIMGRNIESLLERGERIDLLVDQTDRLGGSAREFRVRSRGLKRQMWWKNVKLMGMLAAVAVLLLLTIVVAAKS